MKKYIIILSSILVLSFYGCAGSVANPYFAPDIYGQRKHIYEDGVSLIEISETHRNGVYNFRFYENIIASSAQVEMAKKKTIKQYYDDYARKNEYSSYQEIGVTLVKGWQNSYKHKVQFFRTNVANNETLDNYSNSRNIFKEQLIPNAVSGLINILDEHSTNNNNFNTGSYGSSYTCQYDDTKLKMTFETKVDTDSMRKFRKYKCTNIANTHEYWKRD